VGPLYQRGPSAEKDQKNLFRGGGGERISTETVLRKKQGDLDAPKKRPSFCSRIGRHPTSGSEEEGGEEEKWGKRVGGEKESWRRPVADPLPPTREKGKPGG